MRIVKSSWTRVVSTFMSKMMDLTRENARRLGLKVIGTCDGYAPTDEHSLRTILSVSDIVKVRLK